MNDRAAPDRDAELSLHDLVRTAAHHLAGAGIASADARVTRLPDARAIRYYQTLGILSRPLRYAGRRAVYGRRHVLEVIAIKALQARGLSLGQVQHALSGVSTDNLESAVAEALERSPREAFACAPAAESPDTPPEARDSVVAAGLPRSMPGRLDPVGGARLPDVPAPPPSRRPRALVAAEVAPGVVLTIDPARVVAPDDVIERVRSILR